VITTANRLKISSFTVGYHRGELAGVTSRLANQPIDLPDDYEAVRGAVLRGL
jgi:threonine synthase